MLYLSILAFSFFVLTTFGSTNPEDFKGELISLIPECNDIARSWLRLAFHDAGDFDPAVGGGADGSIQFEGDRTENNGLQDSLSFFVSFAQAHGCSVADSIALGAVVSVEVCQGPSVKFVPGRSDASKAGPTGLLPSSFGSADDTKAIFIDRLGFTEAETVALIGGAHTIAVVQHTDGITPGPIDTTPTLFDNKFFVQILSSPNTPFPGTTRLKSDSNLASGPFKVHFQTYADDFNVFKSDFAIALEKMINLGVNFTVPKTSTTSSASSTSSLSSTSVTVNPTSSPQSTSASTTEQTVGSSSSTTTSSRILSSSSTTTSAHIPSSSSTTTSAHIPSSSSTTTSTHILSSSTTKLTSQVISSSTTATSPFGPTPSSSSTSSRHSETSTFSSKSNSPSGSPYASSTTSKESGSSTRMPTPSVSHTSPMSSVVPSSDQNSSSVSYVKSTSATSIVSTSCTPSVSHSSTMPNSSTENQSKTSSEQSPSITYSFSHSSSQTSSLLPSFTPSGTESIYATNSETSPTTSNSNSVTSTICDSATPAQFTYHSYTSTATEPDGSSSSATEGPVDMFITSTIVSTSLVYSSSSPMIDYQTYVQVLPTMVPAPNSYQNQGDRNSSSGYGSFNSSSYAMNNVGYIVTMLITSTITMMLHTI